MSGFVYIMSNPLFSRIKIGRSSKDPTKDRLKQLNSETGTAGDYKCEYFAFVEDEKKLELAVHRALAEERVHKEFFEVSVSHAIEVIREHAEKFDSMKYEEVYFKNIRSINYQNGNIYTGETDLNSGLRDGYGTLKKADGSIEYQGSYEQGNHHGKGTFNFQFKGSDGSPSFSRYEGKWANGKKHGYGEHTFYKGNSTEGDFSHSDQGEFEEGCLVKGIRTTTSIEYDGKFKDNKFHGHGICKFESGASYEGEFKNGLRHGKGIYWSPEGNRFEQEFDNGELKTSKELDKMSVGTTVILALVGFFLLMIFFEN